MKARKQRKLYIERDKDLVTMNKYLRSVCKCLLYIEKCALRILGQALFVCACVCAMAKEIEGTRVNQVFAHF